MLLWFPLPAIINFVTSTMGSTA